MGEVCTFVSGLVEESMNPLDSLDIQHSFILLSGLRRHAESHQQLLNYFFMEQTRSEPSVSLLSLSWRLPKIVS